MNRAHTIKIDIELNSSMRIISGTVRSTPLPWLPVLSNIAPPSLRRSNIACKLITNCIEKSLLYQELQSFPKER